MTYSVTSVLPVQNNTPQTIPNSDFTIYSQTIDNPPSNDTPLMPGHISFDKKKNENLNSLDYFESNYVSNDGTINHDEPHPYYHPHCRGIATTHKGLRLHVGFIYEHEDINKITYQFNKLLNRIYFFHDWHCNTSTLSLPFEAVVQFQIKSDLIPPLQQFTAQYVTQENRKHFQLIKGKDVNGMTQLFLVSSHRSGFKDFFSKVVWQTKHDANGVLSIERTWEFRKLNVGLTALILIGLILLIVAATNNWFKGKS